MESRVTKWLDLMTQTLTNNGQHYLNKEMVAVLVYQVILELNSIFVEKSSFVFANQHGRWSSE